MQKKTLHFRLCALLLSVTFMGILQRDTLITHAFVPTSSSSCHRTSVQMHAEKNKKRKEITIRELIEKVQKNPAAFQNMDSTKPKKYKRTRKRIDSPKQQYLYASQRKKLEQEGTLDVDKTSSTPDEFSPLHIARQFGLVNAAAQHADALMDNQEPVIMGKVRVGDEVGTSGSLAYIVYKPVGWSILGGGGKNKRDQTGADAGEQTTGEGSTKRNSAKHSNGEKDYGSADEIEYDEADVLALMTLEERAEYEEESGGVLRNGATSMHDKVADMDSRKKGSRVTRVKLKDDDGTVDILEYDEADVLAVMTPEEIEEFKAEGGFVDTSDSSAADNVRKIEARSTATDEKASFASPSRPSIVAWLKELKAAEGTPIRGGKYWTAVAGATNVDDTGLVVICPKDKVDNLFIDYAKYIAVVGNGKYLAPKSKTKEAEIPKELTKMDVMAKLRKGRNDDIVLTVGVTVLEHFSTCGSLVQPCQLQFLDGIRGDPAANPLDRRAARRLIHCRALSVSSLVHDDTSTIETEVLPDDIAILAERRNNHEFVEGTFLGRRSLRENPLTTAYREINGAADGFQGWTVDRYDKWLFVQHDDRCYKGPLPSIHDGNTAGVYYLPSSPNRGAMGSRDNIRPTLLEGKAAPDTVSVLENGVTYQVLLDKDLSTGIFLDQRPQRAWLIRHCDESTRVLNCFAHCGAFSVAAASAGASTVSLDLNKKWLDRIEPQLLANGIDFDDKHDCIYGDCFDWLARLAKRGEKYDIVILDPPSSSVGKTKKRWSVKSDMASLVELAAPLVKKGGLLWTTTNSAGIHPIKFARMCQKGFENAGLKSAKLERVAPMPVDFPSIGSQPVTNLVWRI